MSDQGYTLAEALAALIIVGLAVGGVTAAMATVGRMQTVVTRNLREGGGYRTTERAFSDLLAAGGPALSAASGGLRGEARRLEFDCGRPSTCGAELRQEADRTRLLLTRGGAQDFILPRTPQAHFIYLGNLTSGLRWPPAGPPSAGERLRAVAVVGAGAKGETPLAVAHIWREQPYDCAFDSVSRDCQASAP